MKKLLEKINNNQRKKIIVEIVSVLVLMTLFIGVSIAGGYWSYKSSTANTLETGSVSMTFLESNSVIDITNALPKSDNDGKTQDDLFEFAVTTESDYIQTISYDISIEPIVVETGYTGLNPEDIKVYLTDKEGNVLVNPTKLSDLNNFKLYSNKHKHITEDTSLTSKYVLRAWIDGGVRATDWYKEYKDSNIQYQYKFRVNINGKSIEEVTAVKALLNNVGTGGLEEVTHTADSTLQIGAAEDITEYRFRGGNDVVTNNYVYFNCSDINNQTADTCELYRIIGIFPVDDGTGNIENRIKLIKAENYGNNYWNSNQTNNWAEPATLNTTLNTTYWNAINEKYQALVGDAKYYLGGYTTSNINTSVMYEYERKIDESDGGNYYYGTNPANWIGKLALMYASDYGYGANSACSESTTLSNYNTNSCPDNNWLYLGDYEWLLPQTSGNSSNAFYVRSNGFLNYNAVDDNIRAVRPVLYLTSDAQFNDKGDGSSNNPYQLME